MDFNSIIDSDVNSVAGVSQDISKLFTYGPNDILIVGFAGNDGGGIDTVVPSAGGMTVTHLTTGPENRSSQWADIYVCKPSGSGNSTFTTNLLSTTSYGHFVYVQLSGSGNIVFDTPDGDGGYNNKAETWSFDVTLSEASGFIFGMISVRITEPTFDAGYTQFSGDNQHFSTWNKSFYGTPSSAGLMTVSGTPGGNSNTAIVAGSFYEEAGGPGPQSIYPSRLDNTHTFYLSTVGVGPITVSPSRLDNTHTFYQSTVGVGPITVSPSRLDNTHTFYSPTVGVGPITVSPSRLDNTHTFYLSTVGVGPITVSPSRLDNTHTFYQPTISQGLSLFPSRLDNTHLFYGATVSVGPTTVSPSRLDNVHIFYAPTIHQGTSLYPERLDNTHTFYALSISTGPIVVSPSRLDNVHAFYQPLIDDGHTALPVEYDLILLPAENNLVILDPEENIIKVR
jgi:hypothetical protein